LTIHAVIPLLAKVCHKNKKIKETEQEVRAAIEFHIEGVREDGLAAPQPTSIVEYLDIA
jgi:predicted RNase H-like HicB family nuclease